MTESELPISDSKINKGTPFEDSTLSSNELDPSKRVDSNHSESNKEEKSSFFQLALKELEKERSLLEKEILELSNKKSKLENELKESFLGQSDIIARKVKGFQDFLTVSLEDLAKSVETMELTKQNIILKPSPLDEKKAPDPNEGSQEQTSPISDTFKPDEALIKNCLEMFLEQPDFYAEPWKLRRSLDKKEIDIISDWFFNMGGRGALQSLGNRSKNILLSAGLISILGELYGDRFQTLVLAGQPERLGEWRRGLQDALGLGREDFGPSSGIVLFERAEGVIERADRLEEENEVPFILVDSAEQNIDIQVLQFPLWLAFAPSANEIFPEEEYL